MGSENGVNHEAGTQTSDDEAESKNEKPVVTGDDNVDKGVKEKPFSSYPPNSPDASIVSAHVVSLRLLFTAWITHFRSLGYVKDSTMELLDRTVCRRTVELTVRDIKAREAIGANERVWSDLVDLFRVALPSLEGRTYSPPPAPAAGAGYDGAGGFDNAGAAAGAAPTPTSLYDAGVSGPSSNIMVANQATLLRDLQRLDSVLALARNVLTAGERCQNLAAQVGFDREVCAIVNLCVKVTARGFDGDGQTQDEEKWNSVVNGCMWWPRYSFSEFFVMMLISCSQEITDYMLAISQQSRYK